MIADYDVLEVGPFTGDGREVTVKKFPGFFARLFGAKEKTLLLKQKGDVITHVSTGKKVGFIDSSLLNDMIQKHHLQYQT